MSNSTPAEFDVLVVGAGLSGIAAAHYLQRECPGRSFVILEGRDAIGGTWDLFRYPGIRSDSDMFTLGFSFRPWTSDATIARGELIREYVRDTAREEGILPRIRFGHRVNAAHWDGARARWDVEATVAGQPVRFTCRFLYFCSGYYAYEQGYEPQWPGREAFRGRVVHPQHWPGDLDCTGKRVVVIGSGATAITLVPALAAGGARVTMLQRSPSYIFAAPGNDALAARLRKVFSTERAYRMIRWKNVAMGMAFYGFCRKYPRQAKKFLVGHMREQVNGATDATKHFTPAYNPWDQRLCLVPDGDLFKSLQSGAASVVT
ncbi:MAG TPA: NAD(P)/FAD-dependent oxidoreductase, partial [Ramlibacter sp.]